MERKMVFFANVLFLFEGILLYDFFYFCSMFVNRIVMTYMISEITHYSNICHEIRNRGIECLVFFYSHDCINRSCYYHIRN